MNTIKDPKTYYSKKELGRIHRGLSVMNTRNFVLGCPIGEKPIVIDQVEKWKTDFRSYNNILIKKGGHLTIQGTIRMPNNTFHLY